MAGHGFKFLSLSEPAMAGLEREGCERNITRSPLTGPLSEFWKTGVPLHRAAERYYREVGYLK